MTYRFAYHLHGRLNVLEAALNEERRRPAPDSRLLALIKKRKLQLKDRLQVLEKKTATDLRRG